MRIGFRIFSGFAWLVSKLPDTMLYGLSGFLYFLLRYVSGYRNKIIRENLTKCFPEFSQKKINAIITEYYQHMADLIIEVMKTPGFSADQIKNRFSFKNAELIYKLQESGRSFILLTGHLGNWEWLGPGMQLNFPAFSGYAVVKPIKNPDFHKYMSDLRRIHKSDSLIPYKQTLRFMIRNKDKLTLTLFAADQTPHKGGIKFNAYFFNRLTPFFTGFESIARMLDEAVVFADVYRTRRGHYEVEFRLITDTPKSIAENEITLEFIRLLEEAIRKRPYNWLWSHRRWKHAPKVDQQENQDRA